MYSPLMLLLHNIPKHIRIFEIFSKVANEVLVFILFG